MPLGKLEQYALQHMHGTTLLSNDIRFEDAIAIIESSDIDILFLEFRQVLGIFLGESRSQKKNVGFEITIAVVYGGPYRRYRIIENNTIPVSSLHLTVFTKRELDLVLELLHRFANPFVDYTIMEQVGMHGEEELYEDPNRMPDREILDRIEKSQYKGDTKKMTERDLPKPNLDLYNIKSKCEERVLDINPRFFVYLQREVSNILLNYDLKTKAFINAFISTMRENKPVNVKMKVDIDEINIPLLCLVTTNVKPNPSKGDDLRVTTNDFVKVKVMKELDTGTVMKHVLQHPPMADENIEDCILQYMCQMSKKMMKNS